MAFEIKKNNLNNAENIKSEESKVQPTVAELKTESDRIKEEELDREYVDKRSVTISLVHNYSNYRRVNIKVLGQRKEIIGSSIRSGQILSSNSDEVNTYFPELIGLSPNHPDFTTRVKAWLSNIHLVINENDTVLNTSFIYKHKKDYISIKQKEDKINEAFDKVSRSNIDTIKEALKRKIEDLNTLESTKWRYGRPQNLEHYLMYRHCLLYKEVAKDLALINEDSTIRFYIKDELKEQERQKKIVESRSLAMRNFVELCANDSKFEAVYIAICIFKNEYLGEALLKDKSIKQSIVMNFVNDHSDKFNKFVNDSYIGIKAFIETLIIRGELIRSEFNQQISTADGQFIGSNMNEAIAWFENPDNKAIKNAFEQKLKLS